MAKVISKGTVLEVTISAVLTPIAQLRTFQVGGQDPGVFNANTLSGNPFDQGGTGYSAQGDVTGDYFYDPDNSTHQFIAAQSQTPLTPGNEIACNITMVDSGATDIPFSAAAIGLGDTTFEQDNGVVQAFVIKPAALVQFPTS